MSDGFDLFKYALSELSPGQIVILSGTDENGNSHLRETFTIRLSDENSLITATGVVFVPEKLKTLRYTDQFVNAQELPFIGLTGQLETFPSEPE